MPRHSNYASHDPRVKALISRTGRVDLFPHLKIPRTTALYWIEQGFEIDDPLLDSLASTISEMREEQIQMKAEILESKTTLQLIKDVYTTLGYQLQWKKVESTETRGKILESITSAMAHARRETCLSALGMSLSRYKRWKREKRGCGLPTTKSCPKYSQNQLTFQEIQKMSEFVTSKEYAHFPIRSLCYYARRKGLLYCTYSTWRKYIDQYGWLRPRKKRRKKYTRVGIRAKHPNQIWHLDVSYFILPDGSKAFIQAIIDNYSRYVLAWQVMSSYDGSKTAMLLEVALKRSTRKKLTLLVDGGGENKGPDVKKLEQQGHFKKTVARFEISYSNSIVEALFRSLKHNHLFQQEIRSVKSLNRHTAFWFKEHNERIPHTAFKGETPLERFSKSWDKEEEIRILVCHEKAIQLRIHHNQKEFCQLCEAA